MTDLDLRCLAARNRTTTICTSPPPTYIYGVTSSHRKQSLTLKQASEGLCRAVLQLRLIPSKAHCLCLADLSHCFVSRAQTVPANFSFSRLVVVDFSSLFSTAVAMEKIKAALHIHDKTPVPGDGAVGYMQNPSSSDQQGPTATELWGSGNADIIHHKKGDTVAAAAAESGKVRQHWTISFPKWACQAGC